MTNDERYSQFITSTTNHTPDEDTITIIEQIREDAQILASTITYNTPASRETSLALTHLEEVVMWAVKSAVLPR